MSTFTVPTLRQIAASAFAAAVSDLEDESDYINLIETLKTFPPAYLKRVIPEMPWLGIRCLWQSGSFSEYLTSEAMTDAVRREENRLRQLFAKNPNHQLIKSKTAGLIDVFGTNPFNESNVQMFKLRDWGNDFFDSGRKMTVKESNVKGVTCMDMDDSKISKSTSNIDTKVDTKADEQEGEHKQEGVCKENQHNLTAFASDSTNQRKRIVMFAEGNVPSLASAGSPSSVKSISEFRKNFSTFTSNALQFLDWSNVLAAGGACTACLLPVDAETRSAAWFSPESMWQVRNWPTNHGYGNTDGCRAKDLYSNKNYKNFSRRSGFNKSRDIDLFLYGLDESQAVEKIKEIYQSITETSLRPPLVIVNGHAVTFYREFPLRSIQVVTRLYKSPAEVLHGFDIDSCCVGFDGEKVLCAPRTIRAFNTRCNMVDMSRRSLTYESRLFKYAKRDFAVIVNGVERNEINPCLFDNFTLGSAYEVKGLQKLLMLELSFRGFREPSCDCVRLIHGLKIATEHGLAVEGPYFYGHSHKITSCLNKKMSTSNQANNQPVSLRDIQIHCFRFGWCVSDRDMSALYSTTGPNEIDANRVLAHQMRENKDMNFRPQLSGHAVSDYEYVTLPWKKGISMEDCFTRLERFVGHHKDMVEWKAECYDESYDDDEGPYVPEFLENVNSHAPLCQYGFDVSKHLHHIKWVKTDAGRQILSGSFHPINDDLWYNNVKLKPGVHKFTQIVLEGIDVPKGASDEDKLKSSMVIRNAVIECQPNFPSQTAYNNSKFWFLKNKFSYDPYPTRKFSCPDWW